MCNADMLVGEYSNSANFLKLARTMADPTRCDDMMERFRVCETYGARLGAGTIYVLVPSQGV